MITTDVYIMLSVQFTIYRVHVYYTGGNVSGISDSTIPRTVLESTLPVAQYFRNSKWLSKNIVFLYVEVRCESNSQDICRHEQHTHTHIDGNVVFCVRSDVY